MNKMIRKLDLLNYEGAVLKAYKYKNFFIIIDQFKEIVDILTSQKLKNFIDGKIDLVDSTEKAWNYPSAHEGAKQSQEKLNNFINSKF
jgi:hypothetical protein